MVDAFVITSAPNTRHVRTLVEEVERAVKEAHGVTPVRTEGLPDATWVLMDYGDFIVHVFLQETRDYYDLEHLWSGAPACPGGPASRTQAEPTPTRLRRHAEELDQVDGPGHLRAVGDRDAGALPLDLEDHPRAEPVLRGHGRDDLRHRELGGGARDLPERLFMLTVTTPPCDVVDSTATSLGMAVKTPLAVSSAVGPCSMAARMDVSGAGGSTTRGSGCS